MTTTLLQGCRLFFRSANASEPQLHASATLGVSALLQSVYPPLTADGLRALLVRACREVREEGQSGMLSRCVPRLVSEKHLDSLLMLCVFQAETPSEQMQVMQLTAALASFHNAAALALSCPSLR